MDLAYYIAHPEELDQETLYDLRRLVAVYPTYHAARILFLQNLFLLHDPTFDQELRRAALLLPDRRVLFALTQTTGRPQKSRAANTPPKTQEAAQQKPAAKTEASTKDSTAALSTTAPAATGTATLAAEMPPVATGTTTPATGTGTPVTGTTTPATETTTPVTGTTTPATGTTTPATGTTTPATGTVTSTASAAAPAAAKNKKPAKKYAVSDTTSTLLDNFLDSPERPLRKKRIKADPSTDYMAYLMQQEEEEISHSASDGNDTEASRLDSLIDTFIASAEGGIILPEGPMMPTDVLEGINAEDAKASCTEPTVGYEGADTIAEIDNAAATAETTGKENAGTTAGTTGKGDADATTTVAVPLPDNTPMPATDADESPTTRTAAKATGSTPKGSDGDTASLADADEDTTVVATSAELSETLAHIYIKQRRYDRAIDVLNKINTAEAAKTNPYLADQMRFLQKLAKLNGSKNK